jgi:hypothetical protein
MSKALKTTFLVHAIVVVLFGVPLLLIPGRLMTWVGWAPIDPITSRLMGAVSLALAWSSYRGWKAMDRTQVSVLIEMEAVYTILACVGLLRHLLFGHWPLFPWLLLVLYLVFAILWVSFLVRKE